VDQSMQQVNHSTVKWHELPSWHRVLWQ